jgi:ribonuclease BN (tRNA processing enzyme)
MAGMRIVHSFGLMINVHPNMDPLKRMALSRDGRIMRVFYTADTQFAPAQLVNFYTQADLIFHDCETTPFKSNVHAHFDDLCQLPEAIKKKMWLMHYAVTRKDMQEFARDNGFAGFVEKNQTFELGMED